MSRLRLARHVSRRSVGALLPLRCVVNIGRIQQFEICTLLLEKELMSRLRQFIFIWSTPSTNYNLYVNILPNILEFIVDINRNKSNVEEEVISNGVTPFIDCHISLAVIIGIPKVILRASDCK